MTPNTPRAALDFLLGLSPSRMELGLERMAAALDELGHPERRIPRTLHVAGTNGKGSTCAFADSVLRAAGFRVGLYTSPHLIRIHERFRIPGEEIDDALLGTSALEVLTRSPTARESLTYFELATLIAFWVFAKTDVDVAVLETGLGGRLDATNLCVPTVTAITTLGLDHVELLGSTLAKVAAEKAGIFKPQVPAVIAPQPPEALDVLLAKAQQASAPVIRVGPEVSFVARGEGRFDLKGVHTRLHGVRLGLRGAHQQINAAVALGALEQLGVDLSEEALRDGFEHARWPGRLEEVCETPTVLVDGAHNPQGVEALLAALDQLYPGRPMRLVFGVFADKDHSAMMQALFPRARAVYVTGLPHERGLPAERSAAVARALCPEVKVFTSPAEAMAAACSEASGEELVIAAGSLVLVGAVKAWALERIGAARKSSVD